MFTIENFIMVLPTAMLIASVILFMYFSIQYWRNKKGKIDLVFLATAIVILNAVLPKFIEIFI